MHLIEAAIARVSRASVDFAEVIHVVMLQANVELQNEDQVARFLREMTTSAAVRGFLSVFGKDTGVGAVTRFMCLLAERGMTLRRDAVLRNEKHRRASRGTSVSHQPRDTISQYGVAVSPVSQTTFQQNPSFHEHVRRAQRCIRGYCDKKSFVKFTVEEGHFPMSPINLRNTLFKGGFPGPCSIITTEHPNEVYICAAEMDLAHTVHAYQAARAEIALCNGEIPPPAHVSQTMNIVTALNSVLEIQSVFNPLRREIGRLERSFTLWPPAAHFASALRDSERILFNKLVRFGIANPRQALPPPPTVPPRFRFPNAI